MIDAVFIAQLTERMSAVQPPRTTSEVKVELDRSGRGASLSPVSRAEFEALRLLLRYTRAHLDILAPRLARLECRYGLATNSHLRNDDFAQINDAMVDAAGLDLGQVAFSKVQS